MLMTSLVAQIVKNLPACRKPGFNPLVGRIPWKRKWQSTPAFLPGEFHGQRSLMGHSSWNHRVGHDWVTNTFTLSLSMTSCWLQRQSHSKLWCYLLKKFTLSASSVCIHAQSCLTLSNSMNCSPPGYSVHGILQARILEWVTISFSKGSPHPGVEPATLMSPALADGFFTTASPGKIIQMLIIGAFRLGEKKKQLLKEILAINRNTIIECSLNGLE